MFETATTRALPDVATALAAIATRLQLTNPLVALDLETTGVDPDVDRIVEFAAVRYEPATATVREFVSLVNPGQRIPREATRVHGIRTDDVLQAPAFRHIGVSLHGFLFNADVLGYEALRFDMPVLAAEFRRGRIADGIVPWRRVYDAAAIWRRLEPRSLSSAFRRFTGHERGGDAHRARPDAAAAAQVLAAQFEVYGDRLPDGADELAAFCVPREPDWVDAAGHWRWEDGAVVWRGGKQCFGRSLEELQQYRPDFLGDIVRDRWPADTKAIARDALVGRFPTPPAA